MFLENSFLIKLINIHPNGKNKIKLLKYSALIIKVKYEI